MNIPRRQSRAGWIKTLLLAEKPKRDLRSAIKKERKRERDAVRREDFEEAAVLRDNIKKLKKKRNGNRI